MNKEGSSCLARLQTKILLVWAQAQSSPRGSNNWNKSQRFLNQFYRTWSLNKRVIISCTVRILHRTCLWQLKTITKMISMIVIKRVWAGKRSCMTCLKLRNNVHRHSRTPLDDSGSKCRSHLFESTQIRTRWAIINRTTLAQILTSITSSAIAMTKMKVKLIDCILVDENPLTCSRTSSSTIRLARIQEGDNKERIKVIKSVVDPQWIAMILSVLQKAIIELVCRGAEVVPVPLTMQRASSSTTRAKVAINKNYSSNSLNASLSKTTAYYCSQRCLTIKNMKIQRACTKVSALQLLVRPSP